MKTRLYLTLCLLSIVLGSCADKKEPIFQMKVVPNGDIKNVEFLPNMAFEEVIDSSYYYFDKEDFMRVLTGNVKKGNRIYKDDKFSLYVMLREDYLVDRQEYEFVLRTFSKDFKIIDSYVMGSTVNDIGCNGTINGALEITTTCDDGTSRTATIDEYGKFIVNE